MTAGPEPDAVEELGRWRLRPDVAATALKEGLHLRGWTSAVTLEGSPALPKLWRLVEEALAADDAGSLASLAPAGSPLRAALCTLIGQLHAHDLLVERAGSLDDADDVGDPDRLADPVGRWLRTVAERPAEAARALGSARVRVSEPGPAGETSLARAAVRALARAGVTASPDPEGGPTGGVLLTGTDPSGQVWSVAAVLREGTGWVTPVGSPEQARADATALGARLRPTGGPPSGGTVDGEPEALGVLVAGAAAHRLVCALAGLPDPAAGSEGVPAGRPAVLVADGRPPRAEYHPWLGPDAPAAPAPPATLAEALAGVAALGDGRTGVFGAPEHADLPQLPVALVRCAVPGGTLLAGAARADLARLEALCRAAELRLGPAGPGITVGADPGHALGRALRRAAAATATGPSAEVGWAEHPQASHWWSVLTLRLGVPAELAVARIAPGAPAFHAAVRASPVPGARVRVLGEAVEATAADAAAFAALAAVVRVRAASLPAEQVPGRRQLALPGGAVAPLATAGTVRAAWEGVNWTAGWLADIAAREPALRSALQETCGLHARPWEPGPGAAGADRAVWAALRACGFAVLRTGHDDGGAR